MPKSRDVRSSGASASVREIRERVRELADKIDVMNDQLTRLAERNEVADRERIKMAADLAEIKDEVQSIIVMSSRWKGGFVALAALGGIIGWILTSWESILYILNVKR